MQVRDFKRSTLQTALEVLQGANRGKPRSLKLHRSRSQPTRRPKASDGHRPGNSGKEKRISKRVLRRNHLKRSHSDDRKGNQDDYLNTVFYCDFQLKTKLPNPMET